MIRLIRSAVLSAAIACNVGGMQPSASGPTDRPQVFTAAREVMKQAHYCTLVTTGEDGQPQARIVDPAEPDQEFVVWLATKNATRKVVQLRKDSRASLLYFDRATMSYVTLLGAITLVSDPVQKERHWQAQWAPFYPQGPKTSDLILMRFAPRTLEIFSVRHKLMNDPQTWRPVTVEFKQNEASLHSPALPPPSSAAVQGEVRRALEKFNEVAGSGDMAALMSQFDDGADIMLIGSDKGEVFKGRAAMEGWVLSLFKENRFGWQMDRVDISNHGDTAWAFVEGKMIVRDTSGKVWKTTPYRFTAVLVRRGDGWAWRLFHGSVPAKE